MLIKFCSLPPPPGELRCCTAPKVNVILQLKETTALKCFKLKLNDFFYVFGYGGANLLAFAVQL